MQPDEHLRQFRLDGHRMADLAAGDLAAPVPTCPDWTLADLIEHTGVVHRWQAAVVRDDPPDFPDPATWRFLPEDEAPSEWFRRGVDEAIEVMAAADPDAPRWSWAGPTTVAWYPRRICQETLVHRIDAELAAAAPITPVDPALAVDGVDEMFDVFIPLFVDERVGGSGETVHLHATDTEGEWLVTMRSDRVEVTRGHAKGDAAFRAAALDLLMLVWGREPLGQVERFGDDAVAEKFIAATKQ